MTGSDTSFLFIDKLIKTQEASSLFVTKDDLLNSLLITKKEEIPFYALLEKDWQLLSKEELYGENKTSLAAISDASIHDAGIHEAGIHEAGIHEAGIHDARIVFINGVFSSSLSQNLPKEIEIIDLKNPAPRFTPFLKNLSQKQFASIEKDPLIFLNAAYFTDGILIYLPPETKLLKPLHIVHYILEGIPENTFIAPRIEIFLSNGAEAKFVQTVHTTSKPFFFLPHTSIHLERDAQLSFDYLLDTASQYHLDLFRVFQKENSSMKATHFISRCKEALLDYRAILLQPKAHFQIHGASLLAQEAYHKCHIRVHHQAPQTFSKQVYRGIIKDKGTLYFQGHVKIDPEAQLSEASQLSQNILLGDDAHVITKPYLEIFADDVKATHGATLSHFDEEQLFYLRTRGLSEEMSKRLLIQGFVGEIIALMDTSSIGKKVKASVIPYL